MKEIISFLLAFVLSFVPGMNFGSELPDLQSYQEQREEQQELENTEEIMPGSTFSVQFIDVGQADAALVECDGRYMLIDGGNKEDSSLMYSVLKSRGVKTLELIVGTHPHEDHIGGLPGAYNYAEVKQTLCSVPTYDSEAFADFSKYVNRNGGKIIVPEAGDSYALGSAEVKILGLNAAGAEEDGNNSSIVLMVKYGKTRFLFTGDAEREAEQAVLDSKADLAATVLKVGHHGSDDAATYPFLREVMPQYAVISAGRNNAYGHPMDGALSRLRDAGAEILRTDLQGDIYFTSDGETVSVTTEKTASADELMRSGDNWSEAISQPVPSKPEKDQVVLDYVLNRNTGKFHHLNCRGVKQMSEKNKLYYSGTREEIIENGYSPCGICQP